MIKLILAMQFVLALQWILRLAFSPMQLDFESAPFSRLGTSPNAPLLYHRTGKNQLKFPAVKYQGSCVRLCNNLLTTGEMNLYIAIKIWYHISCKICN